jgi:surface protein
MKSMFWSAKKFNQDLSSWDISNVTNMSSMLSNAKSFNQNISNWCLDNVLDCQFMLDKAKAFLDKYNSGEPLPYYTKKIKEWFNNNRDKMNEIDIKENHSEEINNFFSNINLKKHNLLSECNK